MDKVFVYGTLKKGKHNHGLIRASKFVSKTKTKDKYPLIVRGLPYLVDHPGIGMNVVGEVYEVSPSALASLDILEGHPTFYYRKMIDTQDGTAWAYFINDESFLNVHEMNMVEEF